MTAYIKQSVIITWILNFFAQQWPNSVCKRALDALENMAIRITRGSYICTVVRRPGQLAIQWEESLFCTFFGWLMNLPGTFFAFLYRRFGVVLEGSFFIRVLSAVGTSVHFWLGAVFCLMLVAPHAVWNNAYAFALIVLCLGVFVFGSGKKTTQKLEFGQVGTYLVVYMIFICGAFVSSINSGLSFRFLLFHLTSFLVVLLAVSSVKTVQQLTTMIAVALAGLTVACLYGMAQGMVGVEVVASQQDLNVNIGMPGRVYGFFDNPNNFAEIIVMLLPFFAALFLNAKRLRTRALVLICVTPCVISLGMTYSRSSWIGTVLAVIVFLTLQNWRYVPLGIMAIVVLLPVLPESIWNRILTIGNADDSSTRYRFAIYGATSNLMEDHWLAGVGLGSDVMKDRFVYYPTMFDGNHPIHTHNNYLQIWGEAGIFGLLSYLAVLLHQVKRGIQSIYTATKDVKYLLSAALGAFAGILVISFAEYTWFYPRNMFIFWFLFAIISCCVQLAKQGSTVEEQP